MQMILTTAEIRGILQGCQQTLRLVQSTTEYRLIQSSPYFSTTNDVYIGDAVNVLGELVEAIDQVEQISQYKEGILND